MWDGDQVLFEIRQPGEATTPSNHLELDKSSLYPGRSRHFGIVGYTHGLGIDQPLAMRRDLGSSAGGLKQFTLHRDWRGMVSTSTYAVGADSGLRVECLQGQSTGCLRIKWPAATHNVSRVRTFSDSGPPSWYGTLTQEHRDASGTLYKRNRTYDPVTGRFTQEDPIGIAGAMNLYGFADGDPVTYSDPFGLCPVCDIADVGFFLYSAGKAIFRPTRENIRNAALDAVGLLPIVPSARLVRRVADFAGGGGRCVFTALGHDKPLQDPGLGHPVTLLAGGVVGAPGTAADSGAIKLVSRIGQSRALTCVLGAGGRG